MDDQAIAHARKLLAQYQRNLQHLQLQRAQFGLHCPLHIINEIDDLTAKIRNLEVQIGTPEALHIDEPPL